MTKKLTKSEFFDIYGIFLLWDSVDNIDKKYLAERINEIADKYCEITLDSVRIELRHAKLGGTDSKYWSYNLSQKWKRQKADLLKHNTKVLKQFDLDIDKIYTKKQREKIDFKMAHELFIKLKWQRQYGSRPWGNIAKAGWKLEQILPTKVSNAKKVIGIIDHLNDLEHNNNLYLQERSTFNLCHALDMKYSCDPNDIFRYCSKDIKYVFNEYRSIILQKGKV